MKLVTLLCACLVSSASFVEAAQAARETRLRVVVFDPSGAVIPGALVRVTGAEDRNRASVHMDVPTDEQGTALIQALTPGRYDIEVAFPGFETASMTGVRVRAGDNRREVTLAIEKVDESVAVGRAPAESASDPNSGRFDTVLSKEQIDALPDDPEEMQRVLEDMAGPGAMIRVDGFRGGRLPPKSQIRSIRFSRDPFAAEHHGGGMVHIDIATQPGLGPLSGGVEFTFRDDALNARNAFQPKKGDERTQRFHLNLSGTLRPGKTSFAIAAGGSSAFGAANIFASTLDGPVTGVVRQGNDTRSFNGRLDHALTDSHTLRANVIVNESDLTSGVGEFNLFDRGLTTRSQETTLRLSDSGPIGKSFFNETRLQVTRGTTDLTPVVEAPVIDVLGAFTSGGANRRGGRDWTTLELASNFDHARGRHSFRGGFLLEGGTYRSDMETDYLGRFTFASLDDYAAGRPTTYTRRIGNPLVDYSYWQLGLFLQDDWRARQNLTLSFGLRQETQTYLDDHLNLSPRFGLTWSPFASGLTTVRASAGVFHDWLDATTYEQTLQVDGLRSQEIVVRHPGFPDYFDGNADQIVLPPSRYQLADGLTMPWTLRASLGVQHRLTPSVGANVMYAFSRGYDRLRGRNVNAPDPALGGARPDPAFGNITEVEATGGERRHMVHAGLSYVVPAKRTFAFLNYSLNHIENDSNGAFGLPADSHDLDAEWGPAPMPRHSLNFNVSSVFGKLQTSLNGFVRSGSYYNITTGHDDNGDTVLNDRPAGVGRNTGRAKGTFDVGARVTYTIGFGPEPASAGGGPGPGAMVLVRATSDGAVSMMGGGGTPDHKYRVDLFVSAQNLLNSVNPIGYSGVMTSPYFGQPTGAMPSRRIDLGVRFGF